MNDDQDDKAEGRSAGPNRDALKWLTGGVAVAAAALAIVGFGGIEVGRAIRIHRWYVVLGILLILFAVCFGVYGLSSADPARTRRLSSRDQLARKKSTRQLVIGLVMFLIGTSLLLYAHADAVNKQERPTVSIATTELDSGKLSATVNLKAAGLKSTEYIFIVLQGANSKGWLDPRSAQFDVPPLQDDRKSLLPKDQESRHILYSGRIGSSPDGTVDLSFDILLASGLYERVIAQAVIVNRANGSREEHDVRFGPVDTTTTSADDTKKTEDPASSCSNFTEKVGCAMVLLPAAPIPENNV